MKIYLATWLLEPAQGRALTEVGAKTRLISYFHTRERADQLPAYVQGGTNENLSGGTDRKRFGSNSTRKGSRVS